MSIEKIKSLTIVTLVFIVGVLLGKQWGPGWNTSKKPSEAQSDKAPTSKDDSSPYEKNVVKPFLLKNAADPIQVCYKEMLKKNFQGISDGTVEVSFTILPTGKVDHTLITTNELKSKDLEQCVTRSVGQVEFPPPPGNESFYVKHRFVFKTESK